MAERGTTPSREIAGGVTTFLTMAYIIFVNPNILADAGMDHHFGLVQEVELSSARRPLIRSAENQITIHKFNKAVLLTVKSCLKFDRLANSRY